MKNVRPEIIEGWKGSSGNGVFWRHEAAFQLIDTESVVDLGGGEAILLLMLKEQKGFTKLTLLDISAAAVKKTLAKGFDARLADITAPLPYADNTFQTACAIDVLEHLRDPLPTLLEMKRIARTVVFVVPNFHYWKARMQMLAGKIPFQCKAKREHAFWFNYYVLQDIIEKTGLCLDKMLVEGFLGFGHIGKHLAKLCPNVFSYEFAVRLIRIEEKK